MKRRCARGCRRALVPATTGFLLVLPAGLAGRIRGGEESPPDRQVVRALERRIETGVATTGWREAGERILAPRTLPEFYRARAFEPAWSRGGRPSPEVRRLVDAVRGAYRDGLDPRDYHLATLEARLDEAEGTSMAVPAERLVDLDLLASDAFLVLGSHLLQGRVDPERLEPEWTANRRRTDVAAVLAEALAGAGVEAALEALRPAQPGYAALVGALARLRAAQAAGGWRTVPGGPTLHPGDRGDRVAVLRRRILAAGDLRPREVESLDPALFDDVLADGVRRFQERHGLQVDGLVGEQTLEAMNVPVEARIRQVLVNLERWRWLPADLGRRHIRVNIAAFAVDAYEDGVPVLRMKAIVGRRYRQTPMFSADMRYLVLAPYWHVPPNIAAMDKLPLIETDPGYLAAQRMTLLDVATNEPVDPRSVDWDSVGRVEFNRRFRLRQDPGPLNALGSVKFMFPNRFNVYLHDTPTRELFAEVRRDFSSGCIRLERPLELAAWLLRDDPTWTPERIRAVVAQGREYTVPLPEPVPVHLLYWTAFLDRDDRIQFRPDVYGRDGRVWEALQADPPGP